MSNRHMRHLRPRISRNCRLRTIVSTAASKSVVVLRPAASASRRAAARRKAARRGPGRSRAACGRTAAERVAALRQQVVSQARRGRRTSVPSISLRVRVDRPVAQVLVAAAADGVEAFEREAERVDAPMADGALRVAAVLLDELADGQPLRGRFVLGQQRHVLGRTRQLARRAALR